MCCAQQWRRLQYRSNVKLVASQETMFDAGGIRKPHELIELVDTMSATVPLCAAAVVEQEDVPDSDEAVSSEEDDADEDIDGPNPPSVSKKTVVPHAEGEESAREARSAARAARNNSRKRPIPTVSPTVTACAW